MKCFLAALVFFSIRFCLANNATYQNENQTLKCADCRTHYVNNCFPDNLTLTYEYHCEENGTCMFNCSLEGEMSFKYAIVARCAKPNATVNSSLIGEFMPNCTLKCEVIYKDQCYFQMMDVYQNDNNTIKLDGNETIIGGDELEEGGGNGRGRSIGESVMLLFATLFSYIGN